MITNHGPQATCVVTVEVTQEDIDHGVEGDCEQCPIARAVGRATGCDVSVDGAAILFWGRGNGGRRFDMNTPKEFVVFITRFDDLGRDHVEPFTYELAVPAWVVEGRAA